MQCNYICNIYIVGWNDQQDPNFYIFYIFYIIEVDKNRNFK